MRVGADMDLLFNDLSIHEQFHDVSSFHQAFERLMKMRAVSKHFDREVYCNSRLVNTSPGQRFQMQQAIHQLRDKNKRRAIMLWLTNGPFWDAPEQRKHSEDDLLKCVDQNDQVVTNTAIGEAAFRRLNGFSCGIVSIKPSDWESSSVKVAYRDGNGQSGNQFIDIKNFLDSNTWESSLKQEKLPIRSWDDLKKTALNKETALNRFNRLTFARDCFEPLDKLPFAKCSAEKLVDLLYILNKLANERDKNNAQSVEEKQIEINHFTGDNAWFSDSSETEKQRYREKLTFPHPEDTNHKLFCPYHGKERHLQLRLHFSWPIQSGEPVYVVYIGPKLTRQ